MEKKEKNNIYHSINKLKKINATISVSTKWTLRQSTLLEIQIFHKGEITKET